MPLSALPPGFIDQAAGTGTDWDNWLQRWWKKSWFAYGPRATQWWAKWDSPPKILFKIGGAGTWRYEVDPMSGKPYLSVIQYYKRWHFAISWPFMIGFHFYFKAADVPQSEFAKLGDFLDNKLFNTYAGARYDQDGVYWFPAASVGLTFK